LTGTQWTLNGGRVISTSNVPGFSLDLGGGALDLGGGVQTVGSVTLVSGRIGNGSLTSSGYFVQTGTITASLGGPGGLTKSGIGTVTLKAADSYQGPTVVNAGTLVITSSQGLPDGGSLTVGSASLFPGALESAGSLAMAGRAGTGTTVQSTLPVEALAPIRAVTPLPGVKLPLQANAPGATMITLADTQPQTAAAASPASIISAMPTVAPLPVWSALAGYVAKQQASDTENRASAVDVLMLMYARRSLD
jgi:autotransporter-associated beta strand protein